MADVKKIITDLANTNWSKDNESQMKAIQLIKGLATSDEDLANKFMAELDKASTTIGKNLTTNESEDKEEKEGEKKIKDDETKEEEKEKKEVKDLEEAFDDRVSHILDSTVEQVAPNTVVMDKVNNLL